MSLIGNPLISTAYQTDTFSGDNSTVSYTLSVAPASHASIAVYISGLYQTPGSAYAITGTTITFSGAPPTGTNNIQVLHLGVRSSTLVPVPESLTPAMLNNANVIFWSMANNNVGIGNSAPKAPLTIGTGSGTLTTPLVQATGSANSFLQLNAQNLSGGNNASTDLVLARSDGTDTDGYIDMGINSNTYSQPAYSIMSPKSGYLYVNGGDLTIGTQTAHNILFHTGNTTNASERMRIDANGNMAIGTQFATGAGAYGRGVYIGNGSDNLISLWSQPINTNDHRLTLSNNLYNAGVGVFKYYANNQSASMYQQIAGRHEFYVAGTGTPNSNVSFGNTALTLQSDRAVYSPSNYYTAADGIVSMASSWTHSNGGYTGAGNVVAFRKFYSHGTGNSAEYNFTIDIGTDGVSTSTQYWYLSLPTGVTTWTGMLNVELWVGGWNWGQSVGYKRWVIGATANAWTVIAAETQDKTNMASISCFATPVGSSSCKIGFQNSAGRNGMMVRITTAGDPLSSVTNTYQTNTNPF
jgi:hypothetical protein